MNMFTRLAFRPQETYTRFVALTSLALLAPAFAHETQTAGRVRVTMWTSANDVLRVNADTRVLFDLKVAGKALAPSACRCTVLVYAGEPSARAKLLSQLKLTTFPGGEVGSLVTITKAGEYTVVLDGRPVTHGAFDPFRVQYKLKASKAVAGSSR